MQLYITFKYQQLTTTSVDQEIIIHVMSDMLLTHCIGHIMAGSWGMVESSTYQ